MSFEKKYNEALERAKKLGTFEMPIDPKRSVGEQIFPELAQSKDERIRKWLIGYFNQYIIDDMPQVFSNGLNAKDILAWLEKQGKKSNIPQSVEDELRRQHIIQKLEYLRSLDACNQYGKENINKDIAWLEKKQFNTDIEQVFRPLAGCDIDIAAKQAVEQQKQGKNVVLAFNGCYIPVKDDTADAIVKKYDNWLEKQGKKFKYWNPSKEQLEALDYAYNLCPDTERGNYYEGILETLIADLHKLSEKQDEQKSINKDEPKFHEGDMIIHKELGGDYIHNPHKIIQVDMLDKKYRLEGGFVAHFSEQDDYELIEQKPAQNPKFKVGDWCIDNEDGTIFQIVKVLDNTYTYKTNEGKEYSCSHYSLENDARLWTIQDAKDGDVLCGYPTDTYPWIGIFHELNDDYIFSSYCYLQAGITGKFCPPSGVNIFNRRNVDEHSSKNVVPATKEQRDFLFQKMKESCYEWDAEKKELKKIEQTPISITEKWIEDYWQHHKVINPNSYNKGEEIQFDYDGFVRFCKQFQNPATWSEEDESNLQGIMDEIEANKHSAPDYDLATYDRFLSWLKSLKERYTWKPSEEQIEMLENIRKILHNKDIYSKSVHLMYDFEELIRTLNKLKA